MNTPPWYAAGLRFSCQRCGACCTGAPGYVWVQAAEAVALAVRLGMDADEFLSGYTRLVDGGVSLKEEADGRCVLFERGSGCRAYEARPRQCRTWPFWARIVATPAAWKRESAGCQGMDEGDLIGPEEIERLARSPSSRDER